MRSTITIRKTNINSPLRFSRIGRWADTFREAQRAKSNPDFISKIEGGMQDLEETTYLLELLEGARLCGRDQLEPLVNEADQSMAIFVTIVRKTKAGMAKRKF
jgi:hypothetical protein